MLRLQLAAAPSTLFSTGKLLFIFKCCLILNFSWNQLSPILDYWILQPFGLDWIVEFFEWIISSFLEAESFAEQYSRHSRNTQLLDYIGFICWNLGFEYWINHFIGLDYWIHCVFRNY